MNRYIQNYKKYYKISVLLENRKQKIEKLNILIHYMQQYNKIMTVRIYALGIYIYQKEGSYNGHFQVINPLNITKPWELHSIKLIIINHNLFVIRLKYNN